MTNGRLYGRPGGPESLSAHAAWCARRWCGPWRGRGGEPVCELARGCPPLPSGCCYEAWLKMDEETPPGAHGAGEAPTVGEVWR